MFRGTPRRRGGSRLKHSSLDTTLWLFRVAIAFIAVFLSSTHPGYSRVPHRQRPSATTGVALCIPLPVSRTALGRIDTKKRLLLGREHRLHALLHLLRRNVFHMRGHPPETPKRIFELARAATVKLIHYGLGLRGAGVRSCCYICSGRRCLIEAAQSMPEPRTHWHACPGLKSESYQGWRSLGATSTVGWST